MSDPLQEIAKAADTFLEVLTDLAQRSGPGGGPGELWTSEYTRARARMHAAAYRALLLADPRCERLQHSSLLPQLASALIRSVSGRDYLLAAADEVMFDHLWLAHGAPTFELTAGLTANLMLTDPGRVSEGDVPWPFPAFRVQLPHPDCPVTFEWGGGPVPVRMREFHVLHWATFDPSGKKPREVRYNEIAYARTWNELRRGLHTVVDRILAEPQPEHTYRLLLVRGYARSGTSIFTNQPWYGDRPVQDWFDHGVEGESPALLPTVPLVDADTAALRVIQRLAVNLALYLASKDEDTGRPVWTPDTRHQGRHERRWTLGRAVKVDKSVRDAAADVAAGGGAHHVAVRHVVRGHFKTAGKAKERIYVKPYWRGPVTGPAAETRTYQVK